MTLHINLINPYTNDILCNNVTSHAFVFIYRVVSVGDIERFEAM